MYELESLDCGQYVLEEADGAVPVLVQKRTGASWAPAFAQRTPAPQATVQEQAQARILPSTMHRSPVPDQKLEGEAGTSFKVWQVIRARS